MRLLFQTKMRNLIQWKCYGQQLAILQVPLVLWTQQIVNGIQHYLHQN